MVPVYTGHYHYNGNNGNDNVRILDTGFKPLFTVTGFMSRYRLSILHTACNTIHTTCSGSPGLQHTLKRTQGRRRYTRAHVPSTMDTNGDVVSAENCSSNITDHAVVEQSEPAPAHPPRTAAQEKIHRLKTWDKMKPSNGTARLWL